MARPGVVGAAIAAVSASSRADISAATDLAGDFLTGDAPAADAVLPLLVVGRVFLTMTVVPLDTGGGGGWTAGEERVWRVGVVSAGLFILDVA